MLANPIFFESRLLLMLGSRVTPVWAPVGILTWPSYFKLHRPGLTIINRNHQAKKSVSQAKEGEYFIRILHDIPLNLA
jgi:hypothetical protein